ncbi:MAG TPA: hypothetical protein VGI27_05630, partial [Solirubrobacteraceae bacterium]
MASGARTEPHRPGPPLAPAVRAASTVQRECPRDDHTGPFVGGAAGRGAQRLNESATVAAEAA